MKTVFNFTLAAGLLAIAVANAAADEPSSLARLAATVDYVAADYPGAVKDGRVLAESEYREQQQMVAEARSLAREVRPSSGHESAAALLLAELGNLQVDVVAKKPEQVIAADARAVHKRLIDDFGLVLTPLSAPDGKRAASVFGGVCAECHGKDGRADTERARTLEPHPVSFLDAERMARISPQLAFHALTFGVTSTAMASFETLPPSDRWSLAFHVVALRHDPRAAAAGEKTARTLVEAGTLPVAPTASRLAELSDAQLDERLKPAVPDATARENVIAWLRREATFARAPGGTFAEARRLLGELTQKAGDRNRARELAIAAYLEGIEPHEAALKAENRPLADQIERAFFELRARIDAGASPDEIRTDVARTLLVLDGADERGQAGRSVPFFAALAIALREGFEISLLVAALLAFLRKSGHGDQAPWVHAGWMAAVPAGLATWFVVGAALAGAERELTEGVLTLVAAGMLLFVSHFVLGKLESRKWLKFLERKTTAAAATTRRIPWPLVGVAFVAAYREAIEIVLFFRALVVDSPGAGWTIAGGAAVGLVALAILVKGMSALGRRLNPRPVMLVSSVLLTAIAISLVGQGVRALQEGGYLHLRPISPVVSVPVLGIYPSVEGLAAQLTVLALVVFPALLERRKANQAAPRPVA
jgi:high-affinity iron transporter